MWMIHAPRWSTQVAFIFGRSCWSFSSSKVSGSTCDIILEDRLLLWSFTGSLTLSLLFCPPEGNGFSAESRSSSVMFWCDQSFSLRLLTVVKIVYTVYPTLFFMTTL